MIVLACYQLYCLRQLGVAPLKPAALRVCGPHVVRTSRKAAASGVVGREAGAQHGSHWTKLAIFSTSFSEFIARCQPEFVGSKNLFRSRCSTVQKFQEARSIVLERHQHVVNWICFQSK